MTQSQPQTSPPSSHVDILTLDNILTKVPSYGPEATNQLFSLIDCGSNGIRFSVSDLPPGSARLLPCIHQERAPISLLDSLMEGKVMYGEERFPPATIDLVAQTMAKFCKTAYEGHNVPKANMFMFATEAMRRSTNASEMLEAIHTACPDLRCHIAEPGVETFLGGMGARSGSYKFRGLCVDLGGGSLQMSWFNTDDAVRRASEVHQGDAADSDTNPNRHYGIAAARAGQSLPFGAARVIHILKNEPVEVREAEMSSYHKKLTAVFANLCKTWPDLAADVAEDGLGVCMYVFGGGLRGYGSMLHFNDPVHPYPIAGVGSYFVSGAYFTETKRMLEVNNKHKGKIPGMSSRRRDQFDAICAVVDGICAVVPKIKRVTFCGGGNREGALMTVLPESIRESNPLALLGRGETAPILAQPSAASAFVQILEEALPETLTGQKLGPSTVESLGLTELFVRSLWTNLDSHEKKKRSASAAMHHALARDPDSPGLGHLERAVLAVTMVAYRGGVVRRSDHSLYERLRGVVSAADDPSSSDVGKKDHSPEHSQSLFWADYIGRVAAAMVKATVAYPTDVLQTGGPVPIKFGAVETGSNTDRLVVLKMGVAFPPHVSSDFKIDDLIEGFKYVGKHQKLGKVVATAHEVSGN
ncbi:hypothetical protein PspLS_07515 [Pyricularia sp. CBS 133598]|nr:hypothetical protein PspLS_07515 [Pyricularia sp. CBS 133598]